MRHLQFYDHRPGFDLIHLHESETLGTGEPFLRLVVLEFKEDSGTYGIETDRFSHRGAILASDYSLTTGST